MLTIEATSGRVRPPLSKLARHSLRRRSTLTRPHVRTCGADCGTPARNPCRSRRLDAQGAGRSRCDLEGVLPVRKSSGRSRDP